MISCSSHNFNPISHLSIYVNSSPSQEALPSAPATLGEVCSDDNLKTIQGVADCTTACAPAQCCQNDIGSADCGFVACRSYNDCIKLASLVGVDVPDGADGGNAGGAADAGDGSDAGDQGDSGLVEDGEMTSTDGDTNSTGDAGDGDEPTDTTGGGGTFDNPEDGSILDALGTAADNVKDTFKTAMTDPSSLSTGQIVGIAIGSLVTLCLLICLIKCCCCRKKSE